VAVRHGGIAYNKSVTGGDITSVEALFDPKFKGKIGMLTEMRDTVGIVGMATGGDPTDPNFDEFEEAFSMLEKAANDGQIRRFTGNDYMDDLAAGNFAMCIGWSGDIVQLARDNPDLAFAVPDTGGTLWSDTMVIPKGASKIDDAASWMDYVYDPVNAARIAAYVQYISPVEGVKEELIKMGGDSAALADSPLLFPDAATTARLKSWAPLEEDAEAEFDARFAEISGT
jgi:spermidine/putrescine transport system substrate-binding protein